MNEQPESIHDFCSRIEGDCEKEISSIIERAEYTAKARAESILDEAEKKKNDVLEKAEKDSESARRIVLSDLNLELKKVGLRIRGEVVEEAMAMLREKFSELRSMPEYREFIARLALEGIRVLDEDEVMLKLGELDEGILTENLLNRIISRAVELLGRNISVSVDDKSIKGQAGIRIISKGGNMLFDNTIEARLRRMGDDLRFLIARKIFG